mmetsp:Transcript_23396/g.70102  ORF Transcript_23396/g.70102 Transcript_23396/m.70102 type:complete len:228 (+) Transcript_23396:15-698(+)
MLLKPRLFVVVELDGGREADRHRGRRVFPLPVGLHIVGPDGWAYLGLAAPLVLRHARRQVPLDGELGMARGTDDRPVRRRGLPRMFLEGSHREFDALVGVFLANTWREGSAEGARLERARLEEHDRTVRGRPAADEAYLLVHHALHRVEHVRGEVLQAGRPAVERLLAEGARPRRSRRRGHGFRDLKEGLVVARAVPRVARDLGEHGFVVREPKWQPLTSNVSPMVA